VFAAFLHPFPIRGLRAPLLWVFYRLVNQFGSDIVFLLSRDYLESPEIFEVADRWETTAESQAALGYRPPPKSMLGALRVEFVPDDWMAWMAQRFEGDGIGPWRHLLLEQDELLEDWIASAIRHRREDLGESIEAVIVWNNCLALRSAVAGLGLPLLHWELGPLRSPQFRSTVYLDMQGVNGGTQSESRFRAASRVGELTALPQLDRSQLTEFFCTTRLDDASPEFEIGVPLQIDDDSNLVAYSNGYGNSSLLAHAQRQCSEPAKLLVRNHPNRRLPVPPGGYAIDKSAGSVAFIGRCDRILTINSGVGAEALVLGKRVNALGDSPYAHIARMAHGSLEELDALRFFLLCYLVPWSLLFDLAYIRWRLGNPSEGEIAARHVAAYLTEAGAR
jgi:hypothetical protein